MRPGVVMLSASFHPHVGGAERQTLELSKALSAQGVPVSVLTRRVGAAAPREVVQGVPVRRLRVLGSGLLDSLSFLLGSLFWLWRWRGEYGVVHAHLAGSPALAAALAGRLLGKKAVVKLGGGRGVGELSGSIGSPAGRFKLAAFRFLRPQFVVVTPELLEEMEAFGLGAAPARVIPNGVDTERFQPASAEEKARARKALGWPDGLGFLYVGRLAPEKRLGFFLEAFAGALRESGAPAFFAVMGEGPERPELEAMAARLGLGSTVIFRPPMEGVERAYAGADVFVLPSVSEGLSNALLESMASGLASLGSRVGGTAEAVREGETGLLFPPGDAAEAREKLLLLLRRPALAAELGGRARLEAESRFDIRRVALLYRELYGA